MEHTELADRPLLLSLPLPLAQAWRRTLYMESPNASHERALYTLEATVKYCASAAASAWLMTRESTPADEKSAKAAAAALDACSKLVRPSLGHWTGMAAPDSK